MKKRDFIKQSALLAGALTMSNFSALSNVLGSFREENYTMPVLFIGHGSPMNALEDNYFTQGWKNIVKDIPTPKAIVCISAHWETKGTKVLAVEQPRMIYDMSGFPKALYEIKYPAKGNPSLANEIIQTAPSFRIEPDYHWGLDHGTWSVLVHSFPDASIPCIQLSLDYSASYSSHYQLAKELKSLRKKGVLFVSSGNIVHNLPYIFKTNNVPADWALEFDQNVEKLILNFQHDALINYKTLGKVAELSVNSGEHYLPLLYARYARPIKR